MSPLWGQKKWILGIHFPKKYDYIRPQDTPHEIEFKLFSNTKTNVTKVGTEKEDENIESGFLLL